MPSFPDIDVMYVILGTPLIARSMGIATALVLTWALAPVYMAVTVTEGGTMSGNWVTGKLTRANKPSNVINTEITAESKGRFMKVLNIAYEYRLKQYNPALVVALATKGGCTVKVG
ncbi:hypothetical protein GCM10027347_23190 [Larkinella harenae]